MKTTLNMMTNSNRKITSNIKMILKMRMTWIMNTNSNMKATSLKANQAKSTKPNLPNQVYETEQKIPNQTKTKHQNLLCKPNWQIQNKLVNKSKQGWNQSRTSLSLPWARHSSAPACILFLIMESSVMNFHDFSRCNVHRRTCLSYQCCPWTDIIAIMMVYMLPWSNTCLICIIFRGICRYIEPIICEHDHTLLSY